MKISVSGKNEVLSKRHIRFIVKLFGKILLSSRLNKNIYLKVCNVNLSGNVWGYCGPSDAEEKIPRTFEILLDPNLSKPKQIRTLAHEMIHLKQLSRGEFKIYDNGNYKWNGEILKKEDVNYYEAPWEKDAILNEDFLIKEYKKNIKGMIL
jgi:hypothetical protein